MPFPMTGQTIENPKSGNTPTWLWLTAGIAALLLVAAASLAPRLFGQASEADTQGLAELRETLRADPASLRGNWLRTLNPKMQDVQGDLVWNPSRQQGVMRFINLPNPPAGMFYQLWLYDSHSINSSVSGAKFQRGSGTGEWYAAIYPTTHVETPYKFELKLESDNKNTPPQIMLMVQP
jgi:hypothetical protein